MEQSIGLIQNRRQNMRIRYKGILIHEKNSFNINSAIMHERNPCANYEAISLGTT